MKEKYNIIVQIYNYINLLDHIYIILSHLNELSNSFCLLHHFLYN